jgi:hypothetical protein
VEWIETDRGSVNAAVAVDVRVTWVFDTAEPPNSGTATYPVNLGAGQTRKEVVIDRIDPERRAVLNAELVDPRWTSGRSDDRLVVGIGGATRQGDAVRYLVRVGSQGTRAMRRLSG